MYCGAYDIGKAKIHDKNSMKARRGDMRTFYRQVLVLDMKQYNIP